MKKILAVVLALAMILGLAACGEKAQEPATEVVENSQGVTDTAILLGNSASTSGSLGTVGLPFVDAIENYLKMANEEKLFDGREVQFVHYDDEFDPVKGKAYLQELVEDDQIFAILGHFGTPVVSATLDDIYEYGIPTVYFATGIGQLFHENLQPGDDGYNIFPVQPIYTTEGKIFVARAVGSFGAKKIGVIYTNDDAGDSMYAGITAQAAEAGVEIVAEQVAAGAADVSAAVTSIKNADVDFVIIAAIQGTFPQIAKEMANQGMTVPAITTYVCQGHASTVAKEIDGHFDCYINSWKAHDGHEDDLDLMNSKLSPQYKNNTDAESGWVAGAVMVQALRRLEGKAYTWDNFFAAMEEAPLNLPFAKTIEFANGTRAGVQSMLLYKVDATNEETYVTAYDEIRSINELLGK